MQFGLRMRSLSPTMQTKLQQAQFQHLEASITNSLSTTRFWVTLETLLELGLLSQVGILPLTEVVRTMHQVISSLEAAVSLCLQSGQLFQTM